MVELGYCIGRCKNIKKCFFVKDYFMCGHLMCYSLTIKFGHCIKCGENRLRYYMNDNKDEVLLNNSIVDKPICCGLCEKD